MYFEIQRFKNIQDCSESKLLFKSLIIELPTLVGENILFETTASVKNAFYLYKFLASKFQVIIFPGFCGKILNSIP